MFTPSPSVHKKMHPALCPPILRYAHIKSDKGLFSPWSEDVFDEQFLNLLQQQNHNNYYVFVLPLAVFIDLHDLPTNKMKQIGNYYTSVVDTNA